eukprot:NODE_4409_length_1172_cov_45.477598_g3896_i0.p1 GENE.NODE_4409_length_1172_cov_45.477598_g3896_i0~~NODE_4409_length_1172_cov_45.477598_g3896_i0.p1  ORF type:complete len:284 (+),score=53.45 NODE_4409_length_1172_cov_45.477598_g3896_i0:99-950(+)
MSTIGEVKCQQCDQLRQKYQQLENNQRNRKQWEDTQQQLIQKSQLQRSYTAELASLKAELFLTQQKLTNARTETQQQATKILTLELRLKQMELSSSNLITTQPKTIPTTTSDGNNTIRTNPEEIAQSSLRDTIYEFEQKQSTIMQYLRQKASVMDPNTQEYTKTQTTEKRPYCAARCQAYIETLQHEIDTFSEKVNSYQTLLQQQQEHHTKVLKASQEKYRELRTVVQLMQQRISSLVFQLQYLSRTRPLMSGPPEIPMRLHGTPSHRTVVCSSSQNPQFNFD